MLTVEDVRAAQQRIAGKVRRTPLIECGAIKRSLGPASIVFKPECLQVTGSFKARGAISKLTTLTKEQTDRGLVTASGGNHGLAVAHAARALGHRAEIFVPTIAAPIKIERLRALGAVVNVVGAVYAEAFQASEARQGETGALVVHAYDQPEVLAGQGTTGREFEEQAPELDTILVAVGGGGFIGGIAAWYGGRVKVVGVEPETSRALHAALAADEPVDVDVAGIAADSLGARRVGSLMFPIAQRFVDHVVLVSDAHIRAAQRSLWRECRVVAEPGGAAALAALHSGRYVPGAGERVGVLVCGANCDPQSLQGDGP